MILVRPDLSTALRTVVTIAGGTTEQAVLDNLVAAARALAGARYAAALLLGPDGAPSALAHEGMSHEQVAALPHLPRPVGLIGLVLTGQTVRLARMGEHPDSVGFPGRHVPMDAFLGVPITAGGRVVGGLYLTRSPGGPDFDDEDEAIADALVDQTSAAVTALRDSAASRELLDGLGLVSERESDNADDGETGSPVIRRLLATARNVLGIDLTVLSELDGRAQTFTLVDAADTALPLAEGTAIDPADGICALVLGGEIPQAVPDVRAHPRLGGMAVSRAFGVGAYFGVPVRLPDGTVYGTLCGLGSTATAAPTSAQMLALATIADLVGDRIATESAHARTRQVRRDGLTDLLAGPRSRIAVQPIVDLTTDRVVGYEALARFTDVTGAPWRPDRVFAEAARLGLGVHAELVAARAALTLMPELAPGTYLSVNLSPAALCDPGTYNLLADMPLDRVVVELTEHEQVRDYAILLHALSGLRRRGLRLAIDDTGSGFAGLRHLSALAPDLIKLDIAFVRDIHLDAARRAVARAVIGFAADVGAGLIAEGIETVEELDQLMALGVHLGQGFLLARPGTPEDVLGRRTGAAVGRGHVDRGLVGR